jgi:DNA topoisomerase-2
LQKPKAKAAPKKAAPGKPVAKKQTTLKAQAKKKAPADSEDDMSDVQISDDDDSLLSHTPPKSKKAAVPKRAGSKPLGDVENESHGDGAANGPSKSGNADKYQKVSLSRPQQYHR